MKYENHQESHVTIGPSILGAVSVDHPGVLPAWTAATSDYPA
jgi:hypothetical protein